MLLQDKLSKMLGKRKVREKQYLSAYHWKWDFWAFRSWWCQLLCWFWRDSMDSRRLIVQDGGQAKLHSVLQSFQLWLLWKTRKYHFSEMCYYEQNHLLYLSVLRLTFTNNSCYFFPLLLSELCGFNIKLLCIRDQNTWKVLAFFPFISAFHLYWLLQILIEFYFIIKGANILPTKSHHVQIFTYNI